ncbi:DsbA family protein [Inquilinus sp. CAU 1745]|uniref:DsbA family protein n=1 Tax=Inquilinus sp. CAU 1745 TaxID=3140369 RepID=UPI00325C1277
MSPRSALIASVMLATIGLSAPAVVAQSASPAFDPAQTEAIESVVRNYILEHPEIIMEAMTILQTRQQEEEMARQQQQLVALQDEIFQSPSSPVIGNPEGDVTLVEFFDYQCGYCKRMLEPVQDLVREDGGLRLVMKEFPILGPESIVAARASLAAEMQGLYAEYHNALMGHRGRLTEEVIFAVAEDVGLDVDRLREDMESEAVEAEITANLRLARQLGVNGTPAFVIGEQLIPGAVGDEVLRDLIAEERNG